MPDGSIAITETPIVTNPTASEMHEGIRRLVQEAFDLAREDVRVARIHPDDVTTALRDAFERHADERLAQVPLELWLDNAREDARAELADQIARGAKVMADAMAQARRRPRLAEGVEVPRPATTRFPATQLVQFVNAGVEHFTRGLANGQVAFLGQVSRAEVPTLDRRTRAVYACVAMGRAVGRLLVAMWRAAGADALLLRVMREAVSDGVTAEVGPIAEDLVGRTN